MLNEVPKRWELSQKEGTKDEGKKVKRGEGV
jgi:hypothetical protein